MLNSTAESAQHRYYAERLPVVLNRSTILALVEVIIWSLEQPGCVGPTASLLRDVLSQFIPLVYQHQRAAVLEKWDRVQRGASGG